MQGKLSDRMLPAPVGSGFEMDGYWVWDGSVIKGEDGRYHMFASRWPKIYPMHPGWMIASEVVRASCDTPDGKYEFEEVVLPARGPQYWDGRATHNPQITKQGDKYVLYYTGMTHPLNEPELPLTLDDPRVLFSRSSKRTGIAVADSIFGPWKRFDKPIIDVRPDNYDSFLISNTIPCTGDDGKIRVVYKSVGHQKPPYTTVSIHDDIQKLGALIVDSYDGDYTKTRLDAPLTTEYDMEDPFIWFDEDGFNMMAKDMDGRLCGEDLGGIHAISKDGLHWEFNEKFLFYTRHILWDDGVVREMGNLDRPFLLFENGKATHAFFATSNGTDGCGFCNATKTWNMVIPLK